MAMDPELYRTLLGIPYSFGFAAIIVILFTTGSSSRHELYALQYSYVILSCSIMFIFGLLWSKINGANISVFNKVMSLFPFIIIMIITFGIPVLLYTHFDRISKGVSNYYTLFLNISTMLTVAQIWLFFKALNDPYFKSNNALNPKTFSLLTLLGTINLIVCITLGVVLQYYATDC